MTQIKARNIVVLTLLGGLPTLLLLAPPARAQYRVSNMDGHAADANNRLGSGGYNGQTGVTPGSSSLGDNVLTGNVSGLSYFHGNSQTFDANVFQGNTGTSASDRLNAIAAPVNYAKPNNGSPNYTTYYNTSQLTAPPPQNYVVTPGGQGYIPAPAVSPLTPSADTRINNQEINSNPAQGNLPAPGELNVVGPVDPSGNQSMYSMSPLYGVRQNQGDNPDDNSFLSKTTNSRTTPADRTRMDQNSIQQMRNELNKTVQPGDQSVPPNQTPGAVNLSQSQQITDTPSASSSLSGSTPLTSTVTNQQLGAGLSSGQSVQNSLVIPPAKQSKQLAELEKRYNNGNKKLTDVEAADLYNKQVQAQAAKPTPGESADKKTAKPGNTGGGGLGDASTPMIATKAPAPSPAIKPILNGPRNAPTEQPYVITSLAAGMPATGLANLMKSAEELMRQGKFTEAVASYETAEQVAPNNPFISLGRGFAELGASYYGKADLDLSNAITEEPALLAGRYDLKGFLGEDRLNFVQKDLQDIADHEKGARPLVLLAYISHNTGDDAAAARNLNDAATRGGYAKLVEMMQSAWGLKPAAK